MKGWFDVFRDDSGPAWYPRTNRTAVTVDGNLIFIYVIFCTLLAAFLIIFPGIRKERLSTFLTVTLSLFVGLTILVAQYGSEWHTSTTTIISSYSAYTNQRMPAEIGGKIGLMHINITYKLLPENIEDYGDFEFNERFWWRTPHEMSNMFKDALKRGTPFPIISLAEYFSLNEEGFSWGSKYREAGYYASVMLWTSLASWLMTNLLLIVVPRYGAISMIFTGMCMLLTNIMYWFLLPDEPLVAHVDGSILIFDFGWDYWLVLVAGVAYLFAGMIITAIDMIFPHSFSTILEVDYDTPYDRHVIIEESFDSKRRDNIRQKLVQNQDSFGDQFMRRVSSKLVNAKIDNQRGMVNRGYISHSNDLYEDPNKTSSHWSYPFPPTPRRVI